MKQSKRNGESGSMMLEGMIVMLMTLFVLVFLMSFGFLLYQKWMVTNTANDVATRLAQSYAYPKTDPVMGYLDVKQIRLTKPFRYGKDDQGNGQMNKKKGELYAKWMLRESSLAYPVGNPEITVREVYDSMARRHVEVSITAEYELPLGGALQYFGFDKTIKYTSTGYAACVDVLDYVNSIDTFHAITDHYIGGDFVGSIDTILETIHKISIALR